MKAWHMPNHGRYRRILALLALLSLLWIASAFLLDTPEEIWSGLRTIWLSEDTLVTDYIATAGPGAAFVNAGLVCLVSLLLLFVSGDPTNGFTLVVMGLMAGFSLFGKNIVNIIPIILGTFLYSLATREHFSKYVSIALLATSLSPTVSYLAFARPEPWTLLLALLVGLLIGFCMPPLAAYTFRILNGMNLYNAGFACGIMGMVLIPVLTAVGLEPETSLYWSSGHNLEYGLLVAAVCFLLIAYGLSRGWAQSLLCYWQLLHTSGRAPSDYLRAFGSPAVCINMGVNGLLGMAYILAVGGDLNGPTLGGILTIMGFSAYGKHAFNIAPVILGVLAGNLVNHVPMNNPSMQLAGLFGTTLAPIAGVFGWPAGILAGLLHSSVVLRSGVAVLGMNLYNNGFAGGLVAIVLYPLLFALLRHRRPLLQDQDYFDLFEHDDPISPAKLDDGHDLPVSSDDADPPRPPEE